MSGQLASVCNPQDTQFAPWLVVVDYWLGGCLFVVKNKLVAYWLVGCLVVGWLVKRKLFFLSQNHSNNFSSFFISTFLMKTSIERLEKGLDAPFLLVKRNMNCQKR